MSSRFPKIEKLRARLEPYGFNHSYDFGIYQIGFCRESIFPRLFEHLHVCAQGKHAEVLYAKTALSAIKHFDPDECVSIRDLDLMYRLERNADRHWTEIHSPADKVDWENRLVDAADDACRKTSQKLGAELLSLIARERGIADRFIAAAGDLTTVLDRECAYLNETPNEHVQEIHFWSWAHNDNRLLAGHLFFRLAPLVDKCVLENSHCRMRDNESLRRLIHLIADHVAGCRQHFLTNR